ncbi:MAG: PAS domain S-box protein [Sulfurospirillum sp.]
MPSLTLKQKLLFISFIPFVFALYLSFVIIHDLMDDKQEILKSKAHINTIQHLSVLMHYLQVERGLSTIIIFQKKQDKDTQEILTQVRSEVDIAFNAYSNIDHTTDKHQEITLLRQKIDDGMIYNAKEILDAYSNIIKYYQSNIKVISTSVHQDVIKELIQAYNDLSNAKESLAKIRGVLNEALIHTIDSEIIKRVFSYREAFVTNITDFQTIAPNTIQKLYTEIINNYELEKTLTIINQISHDNHYETSYDIWFTQVTTTINNLYTIEQKLLEQTQISINQSAEKIQNKLSLFIMITLVIIILMLFVIHFISTNIIQSTQKLEKSYETSQQLLQQYKDAIDKSFIVSKTDKAGIITYVNEQFCEISGYSIHELIGSSHNIIRHPDTSKETFQELWTTIQKGKRWHGVIKNRKKDGSAYWLDAYIHPIIDLKGNITEYISVRHDVTPFYIMRDNLFKSLKISHANLNQVTHLSKQYENVINESNSVIRVDIHGKVLFVNNRFCEISGYAQEEILGLDFFKTYAEDMGKETVNEMWATIKNGSIWRGILKNKRKDGTPYWVKATVVPIKNQNGDVIEFMSIRNDITEVIRLQEEIEKTQQEVIYYLGEVAESKSKETGNHVKRVAEYSRLLALKYGIDSKEANLIANASPMHDIGKVGIPDYILHKKGKLTEQEWEIMQTHAALGYNVFKNSTHPLLQTAALIALEHHEKYNGKGYPQNLQGENIHLYARIVAIADVFDALSHDRCYKKAWNDDVIFEFFEREKGEHFDPKLVDLFLNSKEEFIKIRNALRDL